MTLGSQRLLRFFLFLCLLAKVDFHVASSLVRAREASAAGITREGFLARVGSDVRCKMIGTREIPHTDATLERFLSCVGSHVPCELVGAREPSRAGLNRAAIRSFTWRCFCSLRELVAAFNLQDAATSLYGSVDVDVVVVVVGDGFGNLEHVVVQKIVSCGVQQLVEARV